MGAFSEYSVIEATFFEDVQDALERAKRYHEIHGYSDEREEDQFDSYYSKDIAMLPAIAKSQSEAVDDVLDKTKKWGGLAAKLFYPKNFDAHIAQERLAAKRQALVVYMKAKKDIYQSTASIYEKRDRLDSAYALYLKVPHVYKAVYGGWIRDD